MSVMDNRYIWSLTICPCLAIFLMSAIIFFSCCSSLCLSLSRSLIARFSALWFCRNISSGVFLFPNRNSIWSIAKSQDYIKDKNMLCICPVYLFKHNNVLKFVHHIMFGIMKRAWHYPLNVNNSDYTSLRYYFRHGQSLKYVVSE